MIKQKLVQLIQDALRRARSDGSLPSAEEAPLTDFEPQLDAPKQKEHGDYATNIALILAKPMQKASREIAMAIVSHLEADADVEGVDVAGPGFINFRLRPGWLHEVVREIDREQSKFGATRRHEGKRVLVEFVSANPNGPITVAHGRGGAIGDALASLLEAVGYDVEREFYINDALNSTQMNNFGKSVHFRYMQALGADMGPDDETDGPDWLYRGDYVFDIAKAIVGRVGDRYKAADISDAATVHLFRELAQEGMRQEQEDDLKSFGIVFDTWFSENTLHESGRVKEAIDFLTAKGFTYEQDSALWLRTTDFGDDKDRVILRANGTPTYIAGDVAYHKDKLDRGFDRLIDVWGADHGGYVARTKAGVAATGYDADKLDILLFQLVRIMQNGEMVRASKRRGNVLELKADLIDEIGKDAARFFFLMRSSDTALDIDIDLAKEQSAKNPVYYVQYAHARCCRILEKAATLGIGLSASANLSMLTAPMEIDLMKQLADFPDQVLFAADQFAPHAMTTYLRDLASTFHLFYDAGNNDPALRVLGDDAEVSEARLALVKATRTVLRNALGLLGLESPEAM
jgi:arginyl-tRNA synthetase